MVAVRCWRTCLDTRTTVI